MPKELEVLLEIINDGLLHMKPNFTFMGLAEYLVSRDVRHVIRCKDCKHFDESTYVGGGTYTGCAWWGRSDLAPCEEDDHCCYAERR